MNCDQANVSWLHRTKDNWQQSATVKSGACLEKGCWDKGSKFAPDYRTAFGFCPKVCLNSICCWRPCDMIKHTKMLLLNWLFVFIHCKSNVQNEIGNHIKVGEQQRRRWFRKESNTSSREKKYLHNFREKMFTKLNKYKEKRLNEWTAPRSEEVY